MMHIFVDEITVIKKTKLIHHWFFIFHRLKYYMYA